MLSLFELSVSGGVLIAAVALLRLAAGRRIPRRIFSLLWLVALCRLLIPVALPSPVSVYAAAGQLGVLPRRSGVLTGAAPVPPVMSENPQALTAAGGDGARALWVWIWLAGLVVFTLLFLIAHLRSRRDYRASLPVEHPFVRDWLAAHRLRRPIQVRYSDQIDSPLTYGVLWPVILLPKRLDWSDEDQLSFILAHEFSHIRHFDALLKWFLAAAVCVHWFNPLVYLMYLLANRDLELTCDAWVISEHGPDSRAAYATTLVDLEAGRSGFAPLASCFNRSAMEERIRAIMRSPLTTRGGLIGGLALVAIVAAVFATCAPKNQRSDTPVREVDMGLRPIHEGTAYVQMIPKGSGIIGAFETQDRLAGTGSYGGGYTQAQYDLVLEKLKFDGYETMSIAEFNRRINTALNRGERWEREDLPLAYESVLCGLPADDPNAPFLLNTVQASVMEYNARLQEVYTNQTIDPVFSGSAVHEWNADVFGEQVSIGALQVDYQFTYRILDQDNLTVAERDQFLQAVMEGAKNVLDGLSLREMSKSELETQFTAGLEEAGKALSNDKISFTGCKVAYLDVYGEGCVTQVAQAGKELA